MLGRGLEYSSLVFPNKNNVIKKVKLLSSQTLKPLHFSQLPDFLGGSCLCPNEGGCLGSNKGPWNDTQLMKVDVLDQTFNLCI